MRAIPAILLLSILGGVGGQRGLADGPAGPDLFKRHEDLANALVGLGFDEVHVYPYTGLPKGTINFVEGQDVKPIDLQAAVLAQAKKIPIPGDDFGPDTLSGCVVIAVKKAAGEGAAGRPCLISVAVRREAPLDLGMGMKGTQSQRAVFQISGTVPERANKSDSKSTPLRAGRGSTIYSARESFTAKGGKEFTFYDLRLAHDREGEKDKQPK